MTGLEGGFSKGVSHGSAFDDGRGGVRQSDAGGIPAGDERDGRRGERGADGQRDQRFGNAGAGFDGGIQTQGI